MINRCHKSFKQFCRDIKYGIQNLIVWLPIIWNDRQWDYFYLYSLLNKKFELMENYFKKYSCCLESEEIAKIITEMKEACKRLIEDDYYDAPVEVDFSLGKRGTFIRPELTDEQRALFMKAFQKEVELKKKDKDLVFDLLKEHIDELWD